MNPPPPVVMVRPQPQPAPRGPERGQFTLQAALRKNAPPWFSIGQYDPTDRRPLYWFWSFLDARAAIEEDRARRPYVLGPNVFFADCHHIGRDHHERRLLAYRSCVLHFTESQWYADLIREAYGQHGRQAPPIALWPYPVEDIPGPIEPATIDLLIYAKTGHTAEAIGHLQKRWPNCAVFRYGRFDRADLIDTARRARACAYFSRDDRGPIALAEILAAGCPAVGTRRGAPWLSGGRFGITAADLSGPSMAAALDDLFGIHPSRQACARFAGQHFDPDRVADVIFLHLDKARCRLALASSPLPASLNRPKI